MRRCRNGVVSGGRKFRSYGWTGFRRPFRGLLAKPHVPHGKEHWRSRSSRECYSPWLILNSDASRGSLYSTAARGRLCGRHPTRQDELCRVTTIKIKAAEGWLLSDVKRMLHTFAAPSEADLNQRAWRAHGASGSNGAATVATCVVEIVLFLVEDRSDALDSVFSSARGYFGGRRAIFNGSSELRIIGWFSNPSICPRACTRVFSLRRLATTLNLAVPRSRDFGSRS